MELRSRATHLNQGRLDAALGKHPSIEVFGTDYATRDGTYVRDHIHVVDLVRAHFLALQAARAGSANMIANLGYAAAIWCWG